MELLQLHYFRTVARLEHMTKAADELHIAQPALSKTIARLEEDLGVPLFDRQSRQIRLNAFGKAFLRRVESALLTLEEGRREVADLAGLEKGSIALATTSLNRLSKALGAFRELHPDVKFRIVQISPAATEEMLRLLDSGEIDLCFTAAFLDRPGLREVPVMHADVCLAIPPGHRFQGRSSISLAEADGEPFIEYKEGHPYRKTNEEICRRSGIRRDIVCEVEEPSAIPSLVLAGMGLAFVPAAKGKEDESGLTLLPLDDPDCRRVFTAVSVENRYLSLAARRFQSFLVHYFE